MFWNFIDRISLKVWYIEVVYKKSSKAIYFQPRIFIIYTRFYKKYLDLELGKFFNFLIF